MIKTKAEVLSNIAQYPIIPVYYHDALEHCLSAMRAVYEGGLRVFEFVARGPYAEAHFVELLRYKKQLFPDLILGIGTIKHAAQAKLFAGLGAQFLVSPIVDASIANAAAELDLLWIPGCMTPTEIALAENLGATLVKLFPGDALGPAFLKAVKPLFPGIQFMPTGGVEVNQQNIEDWFAAGVTAVGLGSKLFAPPEDTVAQRCQDLLSWAQHKTS